MTGFESVLTTAEELAERYRPPHELVARKKIDHVDGGAAALIAASPFVLVATSDADGRCTVSPRGGEPGFVQVLDRQRIALPDYAGNNLLDTARHLLSNPHVGLMFVLPGESEILRVEGHAVITVDDAVLDRLAGDGKRPVSAIGVTVESVFVHCPASLNRAGLWKPETWGRVPAPSTKEVVIAHLEYTAPRT